MKLLKKILIVTFASVLILIVAVWFLRFRIAEVVLDVMADSPNNRYADASPEPLLIKYHEQMKKDVELLSRYPIFNRGSAGTRDAAPFLNPLVTWDGPKSIPGPIALPKAIRDELKKKIEDVRIDWSKAEIDFSWMKHLKDYDYWAFDLAPPLYGSGQSYRLIESPLPDTGELMAYAKLRLLKARDSSRDVAEAFAEVHKLAELLFTADYRISAMATVATLGITEEIRQLLKPADQSKVPTFVWSKNERDAARRYFFGISAFADLRVSDATYEAALKEFPLGRCLAVNEALFDQMAFRGLVRSKFEHQYRRLDLLMEQTANQCRPSFVRQKWIDPNYEPIFKKGDDIFATANSIGKDEPVASKQPVLATIDDIKKRPKLASTLGMILLAIATPNYLRYYER